MLIFSIDVGITNIGVCLYDTDENKKIVFADKVSIAGSLKEFKKSGEHSIIPRVCKLLFFEGKISDMVDAADVVIIEQQMKRDMLLIQYTIGTFCFERNKKYEFINPRSVKTYFGCGKLSRKGTSKSVKGKKNNHAQNKKEFIALASKLFPSFMSKIPHKKKDDVSDAILQAVYYSHRVVDKKRKKCIIDVR